MIPISFVLYLPFLFLFGCYNNHMILIVRAETGRFHLKERCQASHSNYYSNSNNYYGTSFQKRSRDKQYQNLTPLLEKVNHKNDIFSHHAILQRGGGGGNDTNDRAVVVAENQQQMSTMNMLNDKVHNMKETARKIKRTEFWALLALRIAFIFILPLSIIVFGLTFVISLLLLSLRIITLNFCFREVSKISFATVRIAISLIMASITGIISPLFAIFGLLASISVAILEMAEPILRIRYARYVINKLFSCVYTIICKSMFFWLLQCNHSTLYIYIYIFVVLFLFVFVVIYCGFIIITKNDCTMCWIV